MKSKSFEFYDWKEDFEPELLKSMNEILVSEGIDPISQIYGGTFKDGKWVSCVDSNDYRNYWHIYIELWGENLNNDQYQTTYFPHPDNIEEWDRLTLMAIDSAVRRTYEHSDPTWPRHLIYAVRKVLKDNNMIKDPDGDSITFWWNW